MGSAMGSRMLEQGIDVTAWDRSAEHLSALEAEGGKAAESARAFWPTRLW